MRHLQDHLKERSARLQAEVDALSASDLRAQPDDQWVDYLVTKHSIQPLVIHHELSDGTWSEVTVDGHNEFGQPARIQGVEVVRSVPYEGDRQLFELRPSPVRVASLGTSRIRILDGGLQLVSRAPRFRKAELDRELHLTLEIIRDNCARLAVEVGAFNDALRADVRARLKRRRTQIAEDDDVIAGFSFPLRRSDDAPTTFQVPVERKKPGLVRPAGHTAATAEPHLTDAGHRDILRDLERMGAVMERSPRAFQHMGEESLRWVLLVPLNLAYEGQATGETFNCEGKTDILIRWQGRNVFIAECKVWRGPKSLTGALDQLLSYTSWRDTKCAVVLFNRSKAQTDVLAQVPTVVKSHPCFDAHLPLVSEACSMHAFHHPDDRGRRLTVGVLMLHVPSASGEAE